MPDVFTPQKRSDVMSKIRSKGNKNTELTLINIFKKHGIKGWRRNWKLEGKPDFVFLKLKIAIFVDGCFWHRCPKHYIKPRNNKDFWENKISKNVKRDKQVNRTLKSKGWKVIRIWEHDIEFNEKAVLRKLSGFPSSRE